MGAHRENVPNKIFCMTLFLAQITNYPRERNKCISSPLLLHAMERPNTTVPVVPVEIGPSGGGEYRRLNLPARDKHVLCQK